MDVREKMVDLLENHCAIIGEDNCKASQSGKCTPRDCAICLASDLIADGVTVQEWIPVDERLPENFISVLGYMTDAGEFPPVRECYTVGNSFFFPALGDVHPVSHWMPLPQPPKGE